MDLLGTAQQIIEVLWGLCLCVYFALEGLAKWVYPDKFRKSLEGEIALVTGGGSGIGRLIARKLAKLGCVIVTVDISKAGNDETVRIVVKDGGEAHSYQCDLSSREQVYQIAKRIKDDIGSISILVNNAGIVSGSTLLDTPDAKIVKTFDVNVLAHFWLIKAFLPDMIVRKKGHIVNIASLAGCSGTNKLVDYCSSKFAAVGLDDALRVELETQGHSEYIKTTVVCPYYINTGMFDGVQSKLIPILDPDYVAREAVNGITLNKEVVIVPWACSFLVALKHILPTKGMLYLSRAFGFNSSMDDFTGRTKKD